MQNTTAIISTTRSSRSLSSIRWERNVRPLSLSGFWLFVIYVGCARWSRIIVCRWRGGGGLGRYSLYRGFSSLCFINSVTGLFDGATSLFDNLVDSSALGLLLHDAFELLGLHLTLDIILHLVNEAPRTARPETN